MVIEQIDWTKHKVWTSPMIQAERARLNEMWGTPIEREVRKRIRLAVAAYAYEIADNPIMSDHEFDRIAQSIDRTMGTCHPLLDEFFATQFSPMTGMWIHQHPELAKIEKLYRKNHDAR